MDRAKTWSWRAASVGCWRRSCSMAAVSRRRTDRFDPRGARVIAAPPAMLPARGVHRQMWSCQHAAPPSAMAPRPRRTCAGIISCPAVRRGRQAVEMHNQRAVSGETTISPSSIRQRVDAVEGHGRLARSAVTPGPPPAARSRRRSQRLRRPVMTRRGSPGIQTSSVPMGAQNRRSSGQICRRVKGTGSAPRDSELSPVTSLGGESAPSRTVDAADGRPRAGQRCSAGLDAARGNITPTHQPPRQEGCLPRRRAERG